MRRLERKRMIMMKIKMLILVRVKKSVIVIATKNMEEAGIMRRRDIGISIEES